MSHTPIPWKLDDFNRIEGSGFYIAEVLDHFRPGALAAPANAAFIVKACNAHDELVAALEQIAGPYGNDYSREIARAALAKVKA